MRRFLRLFFSLTLIFAGALLPASSSFASTNDFYFESFDAEYYLNKAEEGYSYMDVKETLVAVFPDFAQNHGIERCIPQFYQNVNTLISPNFSVSRNGASEPYSLYTENGYADNNQYTCLRIGDADSYVMGTQTYEISYRLSNVILTPDNSTNQELYWDINGTGWYQKFNSVTATVTLSDAIKSNFLGQTSCYAGKYGISGTTATSRCLTEKDPTSPAKITFTAKNLSPTETLTINLEFSPNSFSVREPEKSYIFLVFLGLFLVVVFFSITAWIKAERKIAEKKSLAKSKIVAPEFTPKAGLTPAEMKTVYLKSLSGSSQVASLLDLAVKKHIALEKGEKKLLGGFKWRIHVKDIDHIPTEQRIVLEILNGGSEVKNNDIIEVKKYSYSSKLERLGRSYDTTVESSLKSKKLFEEKKKEKTRKQKSSSSVGIVLIIVLIIIGMPIIGIILGLVFEGLGNFLSKPGVNYIGKELILPLLFVGVFAFLFIFAVVASNIYKYNKRTLEGIKASKYLDGLKRYMKLAEKDRINFLQSVKGADTSAEGIVKLYEKLLPYAVLFGIEESWMKELNKYYESANLKSDWVTHGAILSASDFRSFSSYTSSSISSSTASSSSSSSGGGGGGFSGGGGGGGGGGGW